MDALLTFFVTAFVSLFVTLDAVGNVPIFLSIPPPSPAAEPSTMVSPPVQVFLLLPVFLGKLGVPLVQLMLAVANGFRGDQENSHVLIAARAFATGEPLAA